VPRADVADGDGLRAAVLITTFSRHGHPPGSSEGATVGRKRSAVLVRRERAPPLPELALGAVAAPAVLLRRAQGALVAASPRHPWSAGPNGTAYPVRSGPGCTLVFVVGRCFPRPLLALLPVAMAAGRWTPPRAGTRGGRCFIYRPPRDAW